MSGLFLSYSHRDEAHRAAFRQAARRLEESGRIRVWHDVEVQPGEPWAETIRRQLDGSRLVVALLSPDFLQSGWCLSELSRAFELRERKLLDVVPIVVRQCAWRETVLSPIQALPSGGAPIESFPDVAAGWNDVVDELEKLLSGERTQPAYPSREEFIDRCADLLAADRRLMLLAPWRGGLEEVAHEVARRTHGDNVTTLRVPAPDEMSEADFYSELSAEPSVTSALSFRQWLKRRGRAASSTSGHLVVLPYFGGPRPLVKQLGHTLRALFDETGTFSLLVLGLARCASLLQQVDEFSLFSGILKAHVPGLDLEETGTLLRRFGADPSQARIAREATGGHPEWTALSAREVRSGRLHGLSQYLVDTKLYGVVVDRLRRERDRPDASSAARVLETLLKGQRVARLSDVGDDLSYPEARLYYDGLLVEHDARTVFRCQAAQLAADRALRVRSQHPS